MQTIHEKDIEEFLLATKQFLNNHDEKDAPKQRILSLLTIKFPCDEYLMLYTKDHDGNIVLVALVTHDPSKKFSMWVSYDTTDQLEATQSLCNYLLSNGYSHYIHGIISDQPTASYFSELWNDVNTTTPLQLLRVERSYSMDSILPSALSYTSSIQGYLEIATLEDLELATEWFGNFLSDTKDQQRGTHTDEEKHDHQQSIKKGIQCQMLYFLKIDSEPVSMISKSYSTLMPQSEHIGMVFTPEDKRNHGYGTKIVTLFSELLLSNPDNHHVSIGTYLYIHVFT
eukprot:TRINITY_DN6363_c0_g1_i2.p1 TRINITY_DN6363_c0_g1~~TRINITY_DN6363_c0_g1_i2.p1  ORF type:complete len:284 (+),score=44.13 TRINITY_DN6363_c0_g1_i2:107-958(+)